MFRTYRIVEPEVLYEGKRQTAVLVCLSELHTAGSNGRLVRMEGAF